MSVEIVIAHQAGSTLAGREQRFPGPLVRLGRRPDNQVAFDPERDRSVSGHHCEIEMRNGGELLLRDLGSQNGTFLDGQRISGEVALAPGARIRLGQGGPEIVISLARNEPVPAALLPKAGIGEATLGRAIAAATAQERHSSRRSLLLMTAGLLLVAGLALLVLHLVQSARVERERAARQASENDLRHRLEEAQVRTERAYAEAQDAQAKAERARSQAAAARTDWPGLVAKVRESIFLCAAEDPESGATGIGTAWVVRKDGLLATNAHVARMLAQMPERAAIQNHTGESFRIRRVTVHPAYRESDTMTPDLALVEIETGGRLLPELERASEDDLARLTVGCELGTLGYPGELVQSYFSGKDTATKRFRSVQATFKSGVVGRLMRYSGEVAEPAQARVVQHSASLSGGTSGSPMFTPDGKVVAVNHAGLAEQVMVAGAGPTQISNPAQIGFAIRIDELTSLLADPGWKR